MNKKLLSREPTPEIRQAIAALLRGFSNDLLDEIYTAIYNAAPALPEPGEVGETIELLRAMARYEHSDMTVADSAADLIAALITTKEALAEAYRSAHERAEKAEAERDRHMGAVRAYIEDAEAMKERAEKAEAERDSAKRDAEHFYQLSGKYLEQKNALEAENERLLDKALRYDLDQAGIKQREAEAIELVELKADNERLRENYNDLIMQVAQKIPGETRHETARRIIYQHENKSHGPEQVGSALDAAKEKP